MTNENQPIESSSHQAPTLNGYAAAWRQQVQVRFYGVYFLHISNTDKSWQHTLKIVKQQ